ncbi:MAG TPA: SDR family oxidoreductase [Flavihumibacter sp.]
MNLKDKVAVITGGTHGIGAAIALKLAREGSLVCLIARTDQHTDIGEQIRKSGSAVEIICADLSKEQACVEAMEEVIRRHGRVDILVHSAGSAAPGSLQENARDTWYTAFDIHIHAAYHLCRTAVPVMKQGGEGAILLISSAAGLRGVRNALAYSVVKGAIPQMTRSLALELSDFNIRVNCISPGVIRTRFQDYLSPDQVKNNIENRIPLHREGTTEDVADAALMLIKNDFITGENVVIDGGMTMRIV